MLRTENLCKTFSGFSMKSINFEVKEGELFVILGPSGVGKTVLLETMAGLLSPDSGRVYLDGKDITDLRIQQKKMGMVYQDQALFPHMTVESNIAYGIRKKSSRFRTERVRELSVATGISHLLNRYPATLSGGEAQRVALARTLAVEPRCILLDEPISSLDVSSRRTMRRLLRSLNREGHTMLYVTHDFDEAISLASRIAVMEKGRIVQTDLPEEVFRHPKSEFIAGFIGIRNYYQGTLKKQGDSLPVFSMNRVAVHVETSLEEGPGFLFIPSTDVLLSLDKLDSSALNSFRGTVEDIASSRSGVEITVNCGFEINVHITSHSLERLSLSCGSPVTVSFKASSAQFFPA